MSHEVETMAYANEVPWHGLGFPVSDDLTPEQMMVAAKLDWTVSKRPLWTANGAESDEPSVRVPGQFALTRDTDNAILSLVGKSYKPVQNADAMDFFTRFTEAGHMTMETAGSLSGGKFVWALARVGKDLSLDRKDKISPYVLLCSPHQVNRSLIIQFTPIRVVCRNTLTFALGAGLRGSEAAFRMPHSVLFDDTAKKAAEKTLGIVTEQAKLFRDHAAALADLKATEEEVASYFRAVAKLPEPEAEEAQAITKDPKLLRLFQGAYEASPGADFASAKGTFWGAFNAVTYVADHQLGRSRDNGLTNAWFGDVAAMKRRAFSLALEKVAA